MAEIETGDLAEDTELFVKRWTECIAYVDKLHRILSKDIPRESIGRTRFGAGFWFRS